MKPFSIILLMLVFYCNLSAQDTTDTEEMKLPWKKGQRVVLNLKFGENIQVEAWNKNEVYVKAVVSINGGLLNHAHKMDSTISESEIEVNADFDEKVIPKNHWCDCDGTTWHRGGKHGKGMMVCSEIFYTVYLPAGADLDLETISGSIKIVNMKGEIKAESVSGAVEVLVPANQHADVHLKTVMGRVASYPDIAILVDGLKPILTRKLEGKLNGGGQEIRLESVTGDVSLRSEN